MKTLTCSFTDQYGVDHAGAICAIGRASKYHSDNEEITADLEAGTFATNSHTNTRVDYSPVFWHSQAAKDANAKTLAFEPKDASPYFEWDSKVHDGMSLEDACLHHFQNVLLPTVSGSVV